MANTMVIWPMRSLVGVMGIVPSVEANGTSIARNGGNAYGLFVRRVAMTTLNELRWAVMRLLKNPPCIQAARDAVRWVASTDGRVRFGNVRPTGSWAASPVRWSS